MNAVFHAVCLVLFTIWIWPSFLWGCPLFVNCVEGLSETVVLFLKDNSQWRTVSTWTLLCSREQQSPALPCRELQPILEHGAVFGVPRRFLLWDCFYKLHGLPCRWVWWYLFTRSGVILQGLADALKAVWSGFNIGLCCMNHNSLLLDLGQST